MSTESPVNTYKFELCTPIDILDIISDSENMQKYHSVSRLLVFIIVRFYWYWKFLISPSHLFCCWVYVSLELPMIYKLLIIICIIVQGIYSYLELSYMNYSAMTWSSHRSVMPITPSAFDLIGTAKIKSPETNTCAGLFTNSDGNFQYKGSVYKIAFSWWKFVKGEIFDLYLKISGPVSIHINFWVVNCMVSAANFKIILHFDVSDSWIIRWCMSWVTDPITNAGWFGGCKFTISVVTSLTSFHSWLIMTDLTIIERILDMFIPVSMD